VIINVTLPRHPLSERGEGTASGRSDSEAVNKSEGRGVSHNHYKDIVFFCRKVIIKTSFCRIIIFLLLFFFGEFKFFYIIALVKKWKINT